MVKGDVSIFLAGDTSYTQEALLMEQVDGVSPHDGQARNTLQRIRLLVVERPLVYLPTHDPESAHRLSTLGVATPKASMVRLAANPISRRAAKLDGRNSNLRRYRE